MSCEIFMKRCFFDYRLCPWQINDDRICLPNIYNYLAYTAILSKIYLIKYNQLASIIWKSGTNANKYTVKILFLVMFFKCDKKMYIIKKSKTSRQAFRNNAGLYVYFIFLLPIFFKAKLKNITRHNLVNVFFLHTSPFL